MGAVVTFDPVAFIAAFPEFASVPTARLSLLFNIAQSTLLDNTGAGPVNDPQSLLYLFDLLVAHMLALFGPPTTSGGNASNPNAPVGRLSSATQGTVSSSFEYNVPQNASAAWYNQTKYGALYWAATMRYRSARYFALGNSGTGYSQDFLAPPVQLPGGV